DEIERQIGIEQRRQGSPNQKMQREERAEGGPRALLDRGDQSGHRRISSRIRAVSSRRYSGTRRQRKRSPSSCPALCRASTSCFLKGVDGRDKCLARGHGRHVFGDITDTFLVGQVNVGDLMSAEEDAVAAVGS